MAYYRGTAREDRAKALAGVLLVHVALGAVILTGLNVHSVSAGRRDTEDVRHRGPPPPPPRSPRRRSQSRRARQGGRRRGGQEGRAVAGRRPQAQDRIPAKPPVAAAPVAGTGSATTSGRAQSGTGPGAGGSGTAAAAAERAISAASRPRGACTKIPDERISPHHGRERTNAAGAWITLKVNDRGRPVQLPDRPHERQSSGGRLFCQLATHTSSFRPARMLDGGPSRRTSPGIRTGRPASEQRLRFRVRGQTRRVPPVNVVEERDVSTVGDRRHVGE